MIRSLLIAAMLSTLAYGQSWSGTLAPQRAAQWTYAGIPGGIPSGSWSNCVTTQCNTVNSGTVTPASLNAACTSAPDNTVIRIPAGNFTINAATFCNRSNVVYRGAGPQSTKFTLSGGNNWYLGENGNSGQGSTWPSSVFTATNWTDGLTQGSTVLTLASTTGISAGQNIVLDQHNAAWVYVDGVENGVGGHCYPGNTCGRAESPLGFGGNWDVRAQEEIVHVVSVDSSTQITISAPGISFDHDATLSPQAFFWTCTASCTGGPNPPGSLQYLGLENLSINAASTDFAVSFRWCDYCWVKNVEITNIARAGIFSNWSYHSEFRDSYFTSTNAPGGPTQYGIELLNDTFAKVENNIFFGITSNILVEGNFGLVVGYNYTLNTASGNQFAAIDTHLAHNYMNLWEGNTTSGMSWDNSWGSASHMTAYRNYSSGKSPNKTNFEIAFQVGAHQHYTNLVANVLGTPGQHTAYVCDAGSPTHSDNTFLYDLGNWNGCNFPSPTDSVTESSMMRWGNWDAVTYAANGNTNGIRYCTGSGSGNPACTASETASTDPTFPGLSSPSTTFPASFYTGASVHSSCGTGIAFWKNPTLNYCPPYPPIGPDVTCSTNCNSNTASHASKIPAQLCYENTTSTTFDAATCYATDTLSVNFAISGALGSGGAGQLVSCYGGCPTTPVTADGSGNYVFNSVPNGTYSVAPTRSGYTFGPANRSVTVSGADVTAVNFTASPIVVQSSAGQIAVTTGRIAVTGGRITVGAGSLNQGPPTYTAASINTADTTTPLTAIFASTAATPTTCTGMCQNAIAEDTQLPGHTPGTYLATRITDGPSYGGKSVGNFTPSGGNNDRTFSYPNGQFLYVTGNGQFVYELSVVNHAFQVVNTGANPLQVIGLGMSTSWLTETRFYNLNSSTFALQQGDINLTGGHIVNGTTTITYTTLFNFMTAGNCPGITPFTPNTKTDIGVSTNDDTFTVGLGVGGQGHIDLVFAYSKTRGPGSGPGCAVTDMKAGKQWNFTSCAPGTCTGTETPTATFSNVAAQCWGTDGSTGNGIHNVQGSGDGNYFAASQDGAWTKGGCAGGLAGGIIVGHQNGTNQWCNNSAYSCNGHNSEGITHDLHTYFATGFSIRAYTDVTSFTTFFPIPPNVQDQHCAWPHNNSGTYDDTLPWICNGNSVTAAQGGVYTPKAFNNEIYTVNPGLPITQPGRRIAHSFLCGTGNGSVFALCADGIADTFGPGNGIGQARPKGDGFCFVSSMLHANGLDNTGAPRADAYCVYMGN